MPLDCVGFDPDAVLQKLLESFGDVWVTSPGTVTVGSILGTPKTFQRVRGGILVGWEPLGLAGLIGASSLQLVACRRSGSPDFSIVALMLVRAT